MYRYIVQYVEWGIISGGNIGGMERNQISDIIDPLKSNIRYQTPPPPQIKYQISHSLNIRYLTPEKKSNIRYLGPPPSPPPPNIAYL